MQFFRVAGGSLASMYAILLVFWYVASKFTEIVRLDEEHQYTMEKYGFFTYMYACGIAYITYILTFVLQKSKFVENQKVSKLSFTCLKLLDYLEASHKTRVVIRLCLHLKSRSSRY